MRVTEIQGAAARVREVSAGRQNGAPLGHAELLLRRAPLQLGLAIRRRTAELVAVLELRRDVDERGPRVQACAATVEALVAVDDLQVLARPGAEDVDRDDAGRATGVDRDDGVVLALARQVAEQDVVRDEAALLQGDLDRVRDLLRLEQLVGEELLSCGQLGAGGRGDCQRDYDRECRSASDQGSRTLSDALARSLPITRVAAWIGLAVAFSEPAVTW